MIIALYSNVMRSGKDTVAELLSDHMPLKKLSFAEPVRRLITSFIYYVTQLDQAEIYRLVNVDKHEVIPAIGCSARHLLQTLGTEWGRQHVHDSIWTNTLLRHAVMLPNTVVTDMRFVEEYEALKKAGAIFVLIRRDFGNTPPDTLGHVSEGQLDDMDFHYRIDNVGDLLDLKIKTDKLAEAILYGDNNQDNGDGPIVIR